ncbi:MAG: hypothetical protein AB3P07_00170, partial [Wolbachia pipientis]
MSYTKLPFTGLFSECRLHDNAEITDKDYLQITITILILFLKEAIMSLTDIAHRVNELASSWEQFK